MADPSSPVRLRPLSRSLDPIPGESLEGYLLRLACRLRLTPVNLARLTGCTKTPRSSHLRRRLLLDLDASRFGQVTNLGPSEATALTLASWAQHYPPIARSQSETPTRPNWADDWLFNNTPRYCPQCLAGDGTPIQQQYGGPWKKVWQLPIAFACPDHLVFLESGCPRRHPPERAIWQLLTQTSDGTLHPTRCRYPAPDRLPGHGPQPSCGADLTQPRATESSRPPTNALEIQRRLLGLLDSDQAARSATRFADIRVVTALLCASWPLGRDLIDPGMVAAADQHVRLLRAGPQPLIDTPPHSPVASAALLTAADALLDASDLEGVVTRHFEAAWTGHPSRAPWRRIFDRHKTSCSEALRQAAQPAVFGRPRRTRLLHSAAAETHVDSYQARHVPAFLEESWFLQHLAPLECDPTCLRTVRRTAAVQLVKWAAGGSMGEAARYLGLHTTRGRYRPSDAFYQWLGNHHREHFNTALRNLARNLDNTGELIDYHRRREALRMWSLPPETWQKMSLHLPSNVLPDRPEESQRQEASVFIWTLVTGGEAQYAPRPIESQHPEDAPAARRRPHTGPWSRLTQADPPPHLAKLQELLIQHAHRLATKIDSSYD